MNDTNSINEAAKTAEFRFGLIAPVIQGLFNDASQTAYFKRITENPITLPDGSTIKYSYKTPEKWLSDYRQFGIEALMPVTRSDKGSTRVLPDSAIEEIFRLKNEFPRINATRIHERLIRESFISASVSVCAVQRFIKSHNLKSARDLNMIDRKAFEEAEFGCMWQADTCYLPHITENGQSRRVYCIMIIDDHSRMIVGGALYYNDNAYNFQKTLKAAVSAYGIPDKLYVDNGTPYLNGQLSLICGAIGTVLIHTKVRDAASKGKAERNFRTLKERWLYTLDISAIHSLTQFNSMLADYIRQHNTTLHTGTGEKPLDRWQRTYEHVRVPDSPEWLDDCFLNRLTRRVAKDATISIDKQSYDAPMQFIGAKVDIRYLPDDMSSAFILYDNEKFPLVPTDKNANCHSKRQNVPSIDYSKAGVSI